MLEYFQIIFVIQVTLSLILIKEYKSPKNVLILLVIYAYHLLFAYFYYSTPTDAQSMYQEGLDIFLTTLPSSGNEVVLYIANICNEYLHLSYLSATILFASLSYIGFWMLFQIIQNHKIKYLWLILLIPSMHFWTAGFGKDCLVFFFISTLLYGVQKNKLYYILLALIGIYLFRPHIAALFGSIYVLTLLFSSSVSFRVKLIATLAALGVALTTASYLLSYLDIDGFLDIYNFALMMQGQNLYGGSSYNVSEYNTFLQVFTYLFRPFFESINLSILIVSIDNLIYFSIFLWVIINIKLISFKDPVLFYLILSFCIFSLIMGFTIANLGLALRQKIMIMPFLLLIFIELMSRKRKLVN
jgi:hypothetical protein